MQSTGSQGYELRRGCRLRQLLECRPPRHARADIWTQRYGGYRRGGYAQ